MAWNNNRTNFDRNLAVVIGIDRYDSRGIHDLQTAVSDAIAIANLLRDEYGYKDEHIVRLFSPKNDEATLKALNQPYRPATLKELRILLTDTLPNQLKPTQADRLVFYFAGHGIPRNSKDGPAGYLVPQTAEQGNSESFLSMRKLHDALSKLECHHLLVILDCCFAGTFRWAGSRKAIPILETVHKEHYDRFIRYPAWQVLTSAAHDQEALDLSIDQRGSAIKDTRHSPFALALIEGLRDNKADVIQDKVITAHELYLYLDGRVNELSREMQTPGIYPMRLEYDRGEYIFTRPDFKRDDLTKAPLLNEENNPYRGLKPFEERHSRFFFGRKALVEALSHRIAQSRRPLTVVLGASGSGKSSLVKAGLLPDLREKQKKDEQTQRWYILNPMRPGKSPFRELARVVLPVANSNLIAQLAQLSFLDQTFVEILDPNTEQNQKAASPNQTQLYSREQRSGDEAFDATKLAKSWINAESEAKLLLVVDYFAQLQGFCHQPQEREQLSSLYSAIEQTLNPLTQTLQQEPQFFTHLMAKWSQNNPNTKLLLVIDQFEELITMSQDDRGSGKQSDSQEQDEHKEWQRFLSLLRMALAKHRRLLHIVLTLRSDFEPRFLNSALKAHWRSARFPVRAMNSDELRDAIEGPAVKQALYFEPPELVGKLIDEVGQMPGALPLLSFTLSELYIKLAQRWRENPNSSDRALRIKDYEELGGVAGALTRRATEEYDNLVRDFGETSGKAYQATMQRVMLRMVTIEGTNVARRRVSRSELMYLSNEENERVETAINRLVNARLLVTGKEGESSYVEPAHDFLVRGWNQLQEWIKDELEELALQPRLTLAVNDWYNEIQQETDQKNLLNVLRQAETFVIRKLQNRQLNRERRKQKQSDASKRSGKSSIQYLWDEHPRLDQLKRIFIKNNWFNRDEDTFVQESLIERRRNFSRLIAIVTTVGLGLIGLTTSALISRQRAIEAETGTRLELAGVNALRQFEAQGEIEALFLALESGKELQDIVRANIIRPKKALQNYPSTSPFLALQTIVNNIHEKNRLKGHQGVVNKVSFSKDGQNLVTGSYDKTFGLWSLNGRLIAQFNANSPNGQQMIAETSNNYTVDLNNLTNTNNSFQTYFGSQQFAMVQQSNFNFTVRLLDQSERLLLEWQPLHQGGFLGLSFSPDGQHVATAGWDKTARIWDLAERGVVQIGDMSLSMGDHQQARSKVEFSPNGQYIVTLGDGLAHLRDTSGRQLAVLGGERTEIINGVEYPIHVYDVRFSPKGEFIVTAESDGLVRLWDVSGRQLRQRKFNQVGKGSLSLSVDGQQIALVADDLAQIWDLSSTKLIAPPFKGNQTNIYTLYPVSSFSPNGQNFAMQGSPVQGEDDTIALWDLLHQRLTYWHSKQGEILGLSFSLDGTRIATAGRDGTVRIWNLSGQELHKLVHISENAAISDGEGMRSAVIQVSFSSDGQSILSVGQDGTAIVWSASSSQRLFAPFYGRRGSIQSASFSPDGTQLATLEKDGTVQIWVFSEQLTPKLVAQYEGPRGGVEHPEDWLDTVDYHLSFSKDGRQIVTLSDDGTVQLRRVETLDELLVRGCNWLQEYLDNPNSDLSLDDPRRKICNGLLKK